MDNDKLEAIIKGWATDIRAEAADGGLPIDGLLEYAIEGWIDGSGLVHGIPADEFEARVRAAL